MSLSLEEGETRQLAEERRDGERGWGRGGWECWVIWRVKQHERVRGWRVWGVGRGRQEGGEGEGGGGQEGGRGGRLGYMKDGYSMCVSGGWGSGEGKDGKGKGEEGKGEWEREGGEGESGRVGLYEGWKQHECIWAWLWKALSRSQMGHFPCFKY